MRLRLLGLQRLPLLLDELLNNKLGFLSIKAKLSQLISVRLTAKQSYLI